MTAVSVITAVHNTPDEMLEQNLVSVQNQDLEDHEHIIVLDNTSLTNKKLVGGYAKGDDRIKVFEDNYNSYGSSFNLGLIRASGNYIGILDGDDYADTNFYKKLHDKTKEAPFPIVRGNVICQENGKKRVIGNIEEVRAKYWKFTWQHWSAIYNRLFLLQEGIIMYPNTVKNNETLFLVKACALLGINSIPCIDNTYIQYVRHKGTLDSDTLSLQQVKDGFGVRLMAIKYLLKMRSVLEREHIAWIIQEFISRVFIESTRIDKQDITAFSVSTSHVHMMLDCIDTYIKDKGEKYVMEQQVYHNLKTRFPTLDVGKIRYFGYLRDWIRAQDYVPAIA